MVRTGKRRGQWHAWWWLTPGAEGLCPEQSWVTLWSGREGWPQEPLQRPLALLHTPEHSSLRGVNPSLGWGQSGPRVKGAVRCGWAGSRWRGTELTVLSLLVAPAQGSPPEQGKHSAMLRPNTWQRCSSSQQCVAAG